MFGRLDGVLVQSVCQNKISQAGYYKQQNGFKTTEMFFLQFWGLEVQDQGATMVWGMALFQVADFWNTHMAGEDKGAFLGFLQKDISLIQENPTLMT